MANSTATLHGYVVDATAGGASYTRTLGIQPDVNTIPIAWTEDTIPTTPGSLVLYDGTTTVTILNLYIDSHTNREDKSGKYIDVVVRDRRWKWAYGAITGEHNRPLADGTPTTEKTARELAGLLLDALGETGYDVTALPAGVYPYVAWEWAKPAEELQRLCRDYGCAVALLLTDFVEVVKLGTGDDFPAGSVEERAPGQKMTGRPDIYTVAGGRCVIQRDAALVPVGLDTDGSIQDLADLSYAPDSEDPYGGFGKAGYRSYDFFGQTAGSAAADAAEKSIWKWYRLPSSLRYMLPVLNEVVETETVDAVLRRKKPYVSTGEDAAWAAQEFEIYGPDVPAGLVASSGYEIDSDLGIVKFDEEQIAALADPGADETPPEITLTFAYRSTSETGVTWEDYYWYSVGEGALEEIIRKPDMVAYGIWSMITEEVDWENADDLNTQAAAIIAAADPGAAWFDSQTALFPGIKTFDLDGKMRSITYAVGSGGATTSVQWNMEFPRPGAPTRHEKTRRAKLGSIEQRMAVLEAQS